MKRYLIIHEDPDTGVQELITNELNDDALEIDANCKQEAIDKFFDSNLVLIPMSEFKAISAEHSWSGMHKKINKVRTIVAVLRDTTVSRISANDSEVQARMKHTLANNIDWEYQQALRVMNKKQGI